MNVPAVSPAVSPGITLDDTAMHRTWLKTGIALVLAGQAMVFGLAVNLDEPEGIHYPVVHSLLFLAAAIAIILLAPPLLRETWSSLRRRKLSVEVLFTLSMGGALVASLVASITRTGDVYYEVVAFVLAIYTVGKALGARSRAHAMQAAGETSENYATARLVQDGRFQTVPVQSLCPGDLICVEAGEVLTMDGVIQNGSGQIVETMITGEPFPVTRTRGEKVFAGSHSVDAHLTITVSHPAGERILDGILKTVREAYLRPSALQKQADRLMEIFLPLVITVHLATLVYWTWQAGWTVGIFNSMAVLLVACPCALGLATPIAVWGTLARLARLGMVARTGDFIETLSQADRIVFDKTGTLSDASLRLTSLTPVRETETRFQADILAAAHALTAHSSHPVARAVHDQLPEIVQPLVGKLPPSPGPDEVHTEPGVGLTGYWKTSASTIKEIQLLQGKRSSSGGGVRSLALHVNGETFFNLELAESLRPEEAIVRRKLAELGLQVSILTGDQSPPGEHFSGVDYHAGLKPGDKVAQVKVWQQAGEMVLYVGDGANDAAAMAESHAGIAMGHSADLTRSTASAVLPGNHLPTLPAAILLTRRIRRGIATNLRFASAYNIAGMALAAGGVLHPVVAALLMIVSSIIVSGRALHLVNKDSF